MPLVKNLYDTIVEVPEDMLPECLMRGMKLVGEVKEVALKELQCLLDVKEVLETNGKGYKDGELRT